MPGSETSFNLSDLEFFQKNLLSALAIPKDLVHTLNSSSYSEQEYMDRRLVVMKNRARKFTAKWSMATAMDFAKDFGIKSDVKKTPLKQFAEAIDDPNYDPDNPPEDYEYEDFKLRLELKEVHKSNADRLTKEIDAEIVRELLNVSKDTDVS